MTTKEAKIPAQAAIKFIYRFPVVTILASSGFGGNEPEVIFPADKLNGVAPGLRGFRHATASIDPLPRHKKIIQSRECLADIIERTAHPSHVGAPPVAGIPLPGDRCRDIVHFHLGRDARKFLFQPGNNLPGDALFFRLITRSVLSEFMPVIKV